MNIAHDHDDSRSEDTRYEDTRYEDTQYEDTRSEDTRYDELRTRVDAQGTELDALRAELAALRAGRATEARAPLDTAGEPAASDRRSFLRGGALAAGAMATGVAALIAGTPPAAAADGDPLLVGEVTANEATAPTLLAVDLSEFGSSTALGFGVTDDPAAEVLVLAPALFGHAAGDVLRVGVQGTAAGEDATGVAGTATGPGSGGVIGQGAAYGVWAVSPGVAVRAESDGGVALVAGASGAQAIGAEVRGEKATMVLLGPPSDPSTRTDVHRAGEVVAAVPGDGASADLWFCVAPGTPGVWRQLAGPTTAGALHVLPAPQRVYDSRPDNPPETGTKSKLTGAGGPRTIECYGPGLAAPGATAVVVNLTVVNTSDEGFVALHAGDADWAGTSTVNWNAPGTVIANSALVALDADGRIAATCAAGASTDLIVDLVGYHL